MRASTTEVLHGRGQELMKNDDLTADSQVPDSRFRIVAAMRRHTLLAAMAAITIATAACSSGGSPRHEAARTGAGTEQAEPDEPHERLTPLSAFFTEGQGGEPTQADRDAAAADFRRQEQSIAACMRAQGFEYVERDYGNAVDAKVKNAEAYDLPPDQYAERWGYGISTIDPSQFTAEIPSDPNAEIVERMSPEARSAYDKAMYGFDLARGGATVWHGDGQIAVARPMGSSLDAAPPDGCQTRALREVYGEDFENPEKNAPTEFDGLNEEMGALWDRVVNDARVVEAKDGWADCMADAGHPEATDPDSSAQLVIDRFSDLYGVEPGQFKEVRAGMQSAPRQPEPAALAAVQSYERSLATADRRCKAPYDDAIFTVQSEVENRFIDEHRAELERYRDSAGLKGGGRKVRARIAGAAGGGKG
jgi:hypothetical protein